MDFTKMDRTQVREFDLGKEEPDWVFWRTRSVQERMQCLEFLRQQFFRYDPVADQLQGVLEVIE